MTAAPPGVVQAPTDRVPLRWILAFSLAVTGMFVGWYGPLQILLAKQAELFAPTGKEGLLALVTGIGALFSLIANPLWGALSDRTVSRYGRRLPWIAGGTLVGAGGLLLLATATGVPMMIVGWVLVQTALNAPFAALSAAIPDQVPVSQRGVAGGYFGVAQTVGSAAGVGLAVTGGGISGGYLACAVFVVVSAVPYLLIRRDQVLPAALRPAWSRREFLAGFWISPARHPDFAWAWLTRFLINLGNALALLYLLFYLKEEVKVADPDGAVLILTGVNAVTLLITVMVAGVWSDRVGNRRAFVTWSGVIMAVAGFLLAGWPTWIGVTIAALVLGVGFGAFTSVDFALMTQVLPAELNRGKDLGVINVANSLPQVLAPAIAAPIVAYAGGYPTLYVASSVIALAGAALVYRIKSVR
ncbi:MFS transporter [Paractinoplanes ferrugineus]|uniref:MFS transporter n=1 Tax=Paractinoplanes ferrugineus TaxID=113564 RepID=A0A919MIM4_9ACTN|nr:MFS transporter [Actinoplanes ferrugineus]GIE16174.1 MFS transporter [Actinoplanes ferrugineus]